MQSTCSCRISCVRCITILNAEKLTRTTADEAITYKLTKQKKTKNKATAQKISVCVDTHSEYR